MLIGKALLAAVLTGCFGFAAVAGSDWPQWRGPQRDGSADLQPPKSWPAKLTRSWSVNVGEGHASPVVSHDRVYVHTREGEEEVVRAIRLSDGGVVWREAWPVSYEMHPAARGHGKGPKSTPAIADGKLFTLGITGSLVALEATTGKVAWRREFASQFKTTSPHFGTASSPLVDRGLLIAYVGGHHDGGLMAFDAKTGEPRWSFKGEGPGYASPIIAELAGKRQIITQSDQNIIGVAPDTGRLLWKLPLVTPYDQNSVTSIVFEDLLIVSGFEHGLRAYRFEAKGDQLSPREVWSRPEASLYMSSPVIAGGRLVGFSHARKGHFFSLDMKTGNVAWTTEGRGGENAALVTIGDQVLALTDGAELLVLPPGGVAFAPLARYTVAESATWAHPVPTAQGLLIKDKTGLALWDWAPGSTDVAQSSEKALAGASSDWPQYRGPRRDGSSTEKGLLKSWPVDGPAQVWRRKIGDGFSSIAVSGKRLYTMHADAESEIAVCLEADTGTEIWKTSLGPRFKEEFGDGPRSTPVVDGDLVYNLTSYGKLYALKTTDGSRVWDVDLIAAFGGRVLGRGVGSTPLVDGDLLIVEGGGTEGKAFQALDKRTGVTRWTSQNGPAGYASGITVTIDGVKQEVFVRTGAGEIVSLLPTGELLWKHAWVPGAIAMPLFVPPNRLFASAADDVGSILIEIAAKDGKPAVREIWSSRGMKNHFNSSVLVAGHIYGFDNASLKCLDAATGAQKWVQRGFGKGSLIAADGLLLILGDQGILALAEATPDAYRETGRHQALTGKTWTSPTLSDGRLYLRDQDEIVSLDLRSAGRPASGV